MHSRNLVSAVAAHQQEVLPYEPFCMGFDTCMITVHEVFDNMVPKASLSLRYTARSYRTEPRREYSVSFKPTAEPSGVEFSSMNIEFKQTQQFLAGAFFAWAFTERSNIVYRPQMSVEFVKPCKRPSNLFFEASFDRTQDSRCLVMFRIDVTLKIRVPFECRSASFVWTSKRFDVSPMSYSYSHESISAR